MISWFVVLWVVLPISRWHNLGAPHVGSAVGRNKNGNHTVSTTRPTQLSPIQLEQVPSGGFSSVLQDEILFSGWQPSWNHLEAVSFATVTCVPTTLCCFRYCYRFCYYYYFIWRSLLPGHGALVPDCSDRTMDGRKRFNLVKIVHNGKFIERFASDKRFAARMNRYRSKPFANQFAGESFQMRWAAAKRQCEWAVKVAWPQ